MVNKIILSIFLFTCTLQIFSQSVIDNDGIVIRSDTTQKTIYLCFTGHDYAEGFEHVLQVLDNHEIQASFFLTGEFIRNHQQLVRRMSKQGHFVGAHSDQHLLYCDWNNKDSLLHSHQEIREDIAKNLKELARLNLKPGYFMPPYEWANSKVVEIASELSQITVNFTPGTRTNADYTSPEMNNYVSSEDILQSIYDFENEQNLNGFHLLIHPGTMPERRDKFYFHLDGLLHELRKKGYQFSCFQ